MGSLLCLYIYNSNRTGKSSECVKDLSDLYALVMTGYILDDFGFNRLNIEEIVKGEQLTHKKISMDYLL